MLYKSVSRGANPAIAEFNVVLSHMCHVLCVGAVFDRACEEIASNSISFEAIWSILQSHNFFRVNGGASKNLSILVQDVRLSCVRMIVLAALGLVYTKFTRQLNVNVIAVIYTSAVIWIYLQTFHRVGGFSALI